MSGTTEPSLSQITNIAGDAAIAGGTAGAGGAAPAPVILPEDTSLKYLNDAAQAKAQANQYISKVYSDNLRNHMTNLNNIDLSKVMDTDLPGLREKYADLANDVAENYDVIRNPNVDPVKFGQLQKKEADLRGLIAQSASHTAIQDYNKKTLLEHPEWNTPENQQHILNYASTPMEQRQNYLLNTPTTFDLQKIAKLAEPIALEQTKKEAISKGGDWLTTNESKQYKLDKFKEAIHGILDNTTVNGRATRAEFEKTYNALPADMRSQYKDSNDYLDQQAAKLLPGGESTSSFVANPYKLMQDRQAFEADESAKARALQLKALKKGEIDPEQAGEAKLRAYGNLITNGTIDPIYGQNTWGDNVNKVSKTIKRPVLDEDGKATYLPSGLPDFQTDKIQVPAVEYTGASIDPKGNIHIHRKDNRINKPADIVVTPSQAFSDLDNIMGPNYTGAIASGSHRYSTKYFNKITPDLDDIQKHFNIPINPEANRDPNPGEYNPFGINTSPVTGGAAAKPPLTPLTVNSEKEYNAIPQGTQYMGPDGVLRTKK